MNTDSGQNSLNGSWKQAESAALKRTSNRKALVTGGSRGIGRGIAFVLAAEGYDVAITYATQNDMAEQVATEIQTRYGRQCVVIQADMSLDGVPAATVQNAVRELGRLDVLVNNAGVTRFNVGVDEDAAMLSKLIDLDFKSCLLAAAAAARHMVDHQIPGNIINITSSRAERAYPEDAFYGGVKAGLKRATESLALKYAPYGIRINCVAPGATVDVNLHAKKPFVSSMARRIPLGRVGTPEDIGNAVAWLVSDKAAYVTGITLRVDGGLILPGMPESGDLSTAQGWGAMAKRSDLQTSGKMEGEIK